MAREARAAEKEAEAIIASLSRASDAAVETTLASIADKLRNNVPLMYHIHALLNNAAWIAVLEASIKGVALEKCSDKLDTKKEWRLRSGARKLFHLDRRGRRLLFS